LNPHLKKLIERKQMIELRKLKDKKEGKILSA
jgi:hypothetical protein